MFELIGIQQQYPNRPLMKLPDWCSSQGQHWLLLGPSGSGKTTLLHILAGLLAPTAGNVRIAGKAIDTLRPAEMDRFRGQQIGIVLQRLYLIESLTVLENLLLAQYLAGLPQSHRRAEAVLDSLGLQTLRNAKPKALSQGQAQRVALARAVINQPKLILADEPTANLDDTHCKAVLDLLDQQAKGCNATLVIATHDKRVKDRIGNQFILDGASVPPV